MTQTQQFFYDSLVTGFVSAVYPVDPQDRRIYVDAVPADCRGLCLKAPVFSMPGLKRNLRPGAQVLIGWFDGNAQMPFVLGHSPNTDTSSAYNQDPLTAQMENFGDLVLEHPETVAFIRFRDVNATAQRASGVDGGPVRLETVLRSGLTHAFEEYNPDGYPQATPEGEQPTPPPAPTRAKHTFKMPTGASLTWDEPDEQHSVWKMTSTAGHVSTVDDVAGKIEHETPKGFVSRLDEANGKIEHETPKGLVSRLDETSGQIIHQTPAGVLAKMDDSLRQILHKAADKVYTLVDGEGNAIAHVAQQIGIGDEFHNLDKSLAAFSLSHMTQFEQTLFAQRLTDYVKVVTAIAPFLTNGAAAISAVQALVLSHIKLPLGSGTVRIKS